MYDYKAPLKDFDFVYFDLLDYEAHLSQFPAFTELSKDVVLSIATEMAKFAEGVLVPLYQSADGEGCSWHDGEVRTPQGFKGAYQQYMASGWPGMAFDPAYGGQGLPESLGYMTGEMTGAANWAWHTYPALTHGAKNTLLAHGSDEQKEQFLTPLVCGEWTATMCLTEPHCGTDLGLLRTKAQPNVDGSYAITGTKIFISCGEHDLVSNIIHVVLARLPDAPEGTKGISLFLVPKFNVQQGQLGERNSLSCGSIEHKMGIKGSATCVMNFDAAKGYLIGEPNKGLNAMFVFMNTARLGTAMQGVCHAELGLQKSTGYARDRLQMRSLTGAKRPDAPADPIIVHPDVRRMLLTQKAFAEGGRMLVAYCALLVDHVDHGQDPRQVHAAQDRLSFLTPIAKAFLTEAGVESANLAVQCFGGHGYIKEWGVEQNLRDSRIATLYEGTTGIQALDLLGRKVLATQGKLMAPVLQDMLAFCEDHAGDPMADSLKGRLAQWQRLTQQIGEVAQANPDEMGAASVDYLMYCGYLLLAYFWARATVVAKAKLAGGTVDQDFHRGKVHTAEFYFARILPRTETLAVTMRAGATSLMSLEAESFFLQC
ncbi:acyl-CoA dehydrogenase [Pseudomonas sp. ICMP22404]|uniref:acyl-CoA dehydrogenase C-terminal domain-containing protein n=1 Tax=Pseudomonas sp. ICMP22404 TaxID=2583807 RepID=UPI00111AEF1E|nr:acyl-CoA dehydrogenase C-terminal domain-containing protein [Pseudomonas sp. ICMP22404]TNF83368.1 acyl-CoA dehydrogenase [Pseudomonas sp. ICMP22404]